MSSPDPSDRSWVVPETAPEGARPGWVMPEAAPTAVGTRGSAEAGDPSREFRDGRSGHGEDAVTDVRPAPRVPVPLKPMTVSDVLDGAWGIIRTRPKTVLGLTAVIVLPVQLLVAFVERQVSSQTADYLDAFFRSGATAQPTRMQTGAVAIGYLALALQAMTIYFLGAAIGRLVSAWYAGGDLTIKQTLGATFRRTPTIVAAFLGISVITFISLLCLYIGALFVIPLFLLTAPIITIEGLGPIAAAQRSWRLVSRRLFPVMGYWVLSLIVEQLVLQAIDFGPQVLAAFIGDSFSEILVPIASSVGHFAVAPFSAGVAVLLYLDLRVRTEGLDIDIEAAAAFASAA